MNDEAKKYMLISYSFLYSDKQSIWPWYNYCIEVTKTRDVTKTRGEKDIHYPVWPMFIAIYNQITIK